MVGKAFENNLNLSLKLHSEMGRALNFSLRKEAVSIATLDKLWARRTSVSGKTNKAVRLKSDKSSTPRYAVGSVRTYRVTSA